MKDGADLKLLSYRLKVWDYKKFALELYKQKNSLEVAFKGGFQKANN